MMVLNPTKLLKSVLFIGMLLALSLAHATTQAKQIQSTTGFNEFAFINYLNESLHFKLDRAGFHGVKNIIAFQKNRNIVVQVIHNPILGYKKLINNLAARGSRTNGINFQNSLTLHILNNYCQSGAFYEIQAAGLSNNVFVQYDTIDGKRIAMHTITRKMCS